MTPRSLRERCLKEFLGVVSWWVAVMLFILSDFVWSHISYRKTTCTAIFSVAFHFTINLAEMIIITHCRQGLRGAILIKGMDSENGGLTFGKI